MQRTVGIIGRGPSGLFLAELLNGYGISYFIVDRKLHPTLHPQAHFVNIRSMELLKAHIPAVHDKIIKAASPVVNWSDFVYCSSIMGRNFSRIDHLKSHSSDLISTVSSTSFVHIPQSTFESIISDHAYSRLDKSSIFVGHEVLDIQNNSEGSVVSLKCLGSSKNSEHTKVLRCKYLIGSDGAHSFVRQALSIPMEGRKNLQSLINVHFRCHGLYSSLFPRPAMLYFVFNKQMVGVFVAHNPLNDEWVCQIPYFPSLSSIQDYSDETIKEIIASGIRSDKSALFDPSVIDILSVKTWTMNAEVASRFSNAYNNVFLIGDAAHSFPPAGGFGMNTGLQDAHNLAWKLAMVDSGQSKPELLQSYSKERQEIAKSNTEISLKNYDKTLIAAKSLGADPSLIKRGLELFNSLGSFVRPEVKKLALLGALKLGFATLGCLEEEGHPVGEYRVSCLRNLVSKGLTLPLVFPREDLDFIYSSVVSNAIGFKKPNKRVDLMGAFTLRIGARIPHVWFRVKNLPTSNCREVFVATSDVVTHYVNYFNILKGDMAPIPCQVVLLVHANNFEAWQLAITYQNLGNSLRVIEVDTECNNTIKRSHSELQLALQRPRHIQVHTKLNDREGLAAASLCSLLDIEVDHSRDQALHPDVRPVLVDVTGEFGRICSPFVNKNFPIVALRPDGHVMGILEDSSTVSMPFIYNCLQSLASSNAPPKQ